MSLHDVGAVVFDADTAYLLVMDLMPTPFVPSAPSAPAFTLYTENTADRSVFPLFLAVTVTVPVSALTPVTVICPVDEFTLPEHPENAPVNAQPVSGSVP